MIRITSRMPMNIARVRLSIDCSMNVAGRKIVVSTSMLGSPGFISSIASSMPSVTSMVLAPRNFWTISIRPGPSLITPSPQIGWWSSFTRPRSDRRSVRPPLLTTGTLPRSSADWIGCTLRMFSRRPFSSTNPPVPTTKLSAYWSTPASTASDVVSMT